MVSSESSDDFAGLGKEFDELLALASDLRNRVDAHVRRSEMYLMTSIMGGIGVLFLAIVWPVLVPSVKPPVIAGGAAVGVAYSLFPLWMYSRNRRRLRRDARVLSRVTAIIGELLSAAAMKEKWSPMKRARYEMQLASLDYF